MLWYILVNGRTDLLQWYGLSQLPAGVRMAYLANTPWVDPNTFEISPNEEDVVLDIGWYEPAAADMQHISIEEHDSFSKSSLAKAVSPRLSHFRLVHFLPGVPRTLNMARPLRPQNPTSPPNFLPFSPLRPTPAPWSSCYTIGHALLASYVNTVSTRQLQIGM